MTVPVAVADGRATRAERTRIAVVDALLSLNEQGNLRPTAREIAAEAGVSLRSIYVHFDDVEALFIAAAIRHAEAAGLAATKQWFFARTSSVKPIGSSPC
jgi:AcrR family transcriptional regulator